MFKFIFGFFAGVVATLAFCFAAATIDDKRRQDARRADDFLEV